MSHPFGIRTEPNHPWLKLVKVPPQFDIRLRQPIKPEDTRFETLREAEDRRGNWIKTLEGGATDHRKLAKLLQECWTNTPCGLSFCPICLRGYRINFVWRAAEAIRKYFPDELTFFVALIPETGHLDPGSLADRSFEQLNNLGQKHQERGGLGHLSVIGGGDLSFNVHSQHEWTDHWQLHHHLVFIGEEGADVSKKLGPYYPASKSNPTPTRADPINELLGALSYTFKSAFFRRTTYNNADGKRKRKPPQSLKKPQLLELALFLSSQTFGDRLYLHGFHRRGKLLVLK